MAKPRQGGLGRGLGALIPSEPSRPVDDSPLRDIPVGDIVPNTYQPRQAFDEEALVALTASVRELGVLQPVLVRKHGDTQFELIAGERRWRAATRAGLDRIPAIVRDVDNETSLAQAIVENVQRAELNAIEEAAAFQQLIEDFSLTQEQVATRVGRSRPAVANALRLLQLPVDVQLLIIDGRISAGHGRVLVTVDASARSALVNQVLSNGLSVRALEAMVRDSDAAPGGGSPQPDDLQASGDAVIGATKPPALLELEELLGDLFATKVGITLGNKRGRVTIDFADIDDLERIYTLMTEASNIPPVG
ncbi:MAG: ParB/RepB/Spo0J family partition protein [Acidimicrobiaceae bacterium]|jgi:ParB family transcriptional regulator, chromosome partitioning protein|nr:ParB/RepB/Spo0J family partition protein [Acidimicrobiaceae bacterium]